MHLKHKHSSINKHFLYAKLVLLMLTVQLTLTVQGKTTQNYVRNLLYLDLTPHFHRAGKRILR